MSQCSGRVKHALSPPFVSSGLLLSPALAGKDGKPAFAKSRLRKRERRGRKTLANRGRRTTGPPLSSPPCLTGLDRKSAQHLCGYMTLYIGHPAYRFARTSRARPNPGIGRPLHPPSPCPAPSNSAEPHGLLMADAGDFTKSTQIGHKLCRNRRNWGHLPACIA